MWWCNQVFQTNSDSPLLYLCWWAEQLDVYQLIETSGMSSFKAAHYFAGAITGLLRDTTQKYILAAGASQSQDLVLVNTFVSHTYSQWSSIRWCPQLITAYNKDWNEDLKTTTEYSVRSVPPKDKRPGESEEQVPLINCKEYYK